MTNPDLFRIRRSLDQSGCQDFSSLRNRRAAANRPARASFASRCFDNLRQTDLLARYYYSNPYRRTHLATRILVIRRSRYPAPRSWALRARGGYCRKQLGRNSVAAHRVVERALHQQTRRLRKQKQLFSWLDPNLKSLAPVDALNKP